MALAATYFTVVTAAATTSTALYTTSSTAYNRDLVITNSGVSTLYVSSGPSASSAAVASSWAIPTGGSLVLTQCQVPVSTKVYGFAAATPAGGLNVSLGWGSVVSVV